MKHIQQRVTTYECNNEHNILENLAIHAAGHYPSTRSIYNLMPAARIAVAVGKGLGAEIK